ncbi:Similar to hypothetical protein [Tuber melanosporum Mel28]; acc. no. XP_002837935 [Pyronema omphalodes CBS 100304]|uniref:Uncharacterized protein n=1 Tax=Pyronema omphalodes (strain CBS 100304) TaxID=1076935 RepID=U4LRT8_PYROM|nr:Similar to hypothetical protein [Tuber melanosporum Mel28]; acc. no. XP_002837935 [Pyronema omphalodes CBS 100304]
MADTINKDIEADPASAQTDAEEYSSGYVTDTASLTSSINSYVFENGRRYHTYFGTEKNLQPADETEQDRLDLHHESFLILLSKRLHFAPISAPMSILDVTDAYPCASSLGIDLSPIQPHWIPPNCRFEVDDAEADWSYADGSFDLIHICNIAQGIKDYPKLLEQSFRCTQPKRYLCLAELELSINSDDGTHMLPQGEGINKMSKLLADALEKIGRPRLVTAEMLKHGLEKAGYQEMKVETYKQPLGPWAKNKDLKAVGATNLLSGETVTMHMEWLCSPAFWV